MMMMMLRHLYILSNFLSLTSNFSLIFSEWRRVLPRRPVVSMTR